jgi:hypothetical protein
MSENLIGALEMLGQGMLGIFVVLGVIALLVVLMGKLGGGK